MNKWFKLALNSFIGLILLNLLMGILFGGGVGFSLGSLLVFVTKILSLLVVVGIIAGVGIFVKDAFYSKE